MGRNILLWRKLNFFPYLGTANAIVHTSPEPKTNVTALWFPPSSMGGKEITFVATVVERNDKKSIWFENLTTLPILV